MYILLKPKKIHSYIFFSETEMDPFAIVHKINNCVLYKINTSMLYKINEKTYSYIQMEYKNICDLQMYLDD